MATDTGPGRKSSTAVPWYSTEPPDIDERARKLLEDYSGIPPERVVPHVLEVRDRAWEVFPYPCIGQFRFLSLGIANSPHYDEVLQRLKGGEKLLDLGCCFGQEIRKLVYDGAPSENCYGSDLRLDFMELGYDLFLDKDRLSSKFIAADFFKPSSDLSELDGKLDMVYAGSFLHLFDWSRQVAACKRIISLLRPTPGALLVGRQVGSTNAGKYKHRVGEEGMLYRHDEATFRRMWEEIAKETDTEWDVEVSLKPIEGANATTDPAEWMGDEVKRLSFSLRRR